MGPTAAGPLKAMFAAGRIGVAISICGAVGSPSLAFAVQAPSAPIVAPTKPVRPKTISDLLATQSEPVVKRVPAPVSSSDPVGALIADPPVEKPPPPSFEVRSRPSIDLSAVVLRPADEALILKTLDDCASHGLHRSLFAAPDLADRLKDPDAQVHAQAERELKIAILRYARAQHGQRLAQETFLKEWGVRPEPWNPDKSFAAAVADDRLAAWIDDLPPPSPGYQAEVELGRAGVPSDRIARAPCDRRRAVGAGASARAV